MLENDSTFDLSFGSPSSGAGLNFAQVNLGSNLLNPMEQRHPSQLLRGTEGDDELVGGRSSRNENRLFGLAGDDELDGQGGDDSLVGNDGRDRLLGGRGNDSLNGGAGYDILVGGRGDDSLVGGSGEDALLGEQSNDILKGGSGDDRLQGGRGNDSLLSNSGQDDLEGGSGADTLVDGDGGDRLTGGRGADQFRLSVGADHQRPSHITDFEPGKDVILFNRLDITPDDLQVQDSSDGMAILIEGKPIALLDGVRAAELISQSIHLGNTELAITLQQSLDQTLPTTISPGVVAAVSKANGELWTGASGLSAIETNTTMVAGDRFPIGSITKTYTATVVMQLVEEGKLSLEGILTEYLPETITHQIANSDQITIRQLLSHTSGINTAFMTDANQDLLANPELAFVDRTPEEALATYVYGRPADFAPGTCVEYNSSNYFLLQSVVEAVTSTTLNQEIQRRILEPLGLKDTFLVEKGNNPGGYQPSYLDINGDGTLDNLGAASITFAGGAGAMVSTVEDTTRFLHAVFEGELLEADTLDEMINGGVSIPGVNGGLGLGFGYLDDANQGRIYISNGDVFGWSSQGRYFEETGTAAIVITNGNSIPQGQNPPVTILNTMIENLGSA